MGVASPAGILLCRNCNPPLARSAPPPASPSRRPSPHRFSHSIGQGQHIFGSAVVSAFPRTLRVLPDSALLAVLGLGLVAELEGVAVDVGRVDRALDRDHVPPPLSPAAERPASWPSATLALAPADAHLGLCRADEAGDPAQPAAVGPVALGAQEHERVPQRDRRREHGQAREHPQRRDRADVGLVPEPRVAAVLHAPHDHEQGVGDAGEGEEERGGAGGEEGEAELELGVRGERVIEVRGGVEEAAVEARQVGGRDDDGDLGCGANGS